MVKIEYVGADINTDETKVKVTYTVDGVKNTAEFDYPVSPNKVIMLLEIKHNDRPKPIKPTKQQKESSFLDSLNARSAHAKKDR